MPAYLNGIPINGNCSDRLLTAFQSLVTQKAICGNLSSFVAELNRIGLTVSELTIVPLVEEDTQEPA